MEKRIEMRTVVVWHGDFAIFSGLRIRVNELLRLRLIEVVEVAANFCIVLGAACWVDSLYAQKEV